jgi:hypothetical protein
MPGFVVLVIPAFLAFVFLPPFLRAAGMAAVRLCTSGVAALVAVVALALAMSALTIISPAASAPVRHAALEMVMSFVIRFVISWLHIGAVGALEIYFAVVVTCKMLKAAPMNAR